MGGWPVAIKFTGQLRDFAWEEAGGGRLTWPGKETYISINLILESFCITREKTALPWVDLNYPAKYSLTFNLELWAYLCQREVKLITEKEKYKKMWTLTIKFTGKGSTWLESGRLQINSFNFSNSPDNSEKIIRGDSTPIPLKNSMGYWACIIFDVENTDRQARIRLEQIKRIQSSECALQLCWVLVVRFSWEPQLGRGEWQSDALFLMRLKSETSWACNSRGEFQFWCREVLTMFKSNASVRKPSDFTEKSPNVF